MTRRIIGAEPEIVKTELARLSGLSLSELRTAWTEYFGVPPLTIQSRSLVLRLLAWRIQERAFGHLDASTQRKLDSVITRIEQDGDYTPKIRRNFLVGVDLTREWKGVTYKVTVTGDGFLLFNKSYKSLSEVARAITGTRWSGPRFFRLEKKSSNQLQGPSP